MSLHQFDQTRRFKKSEESIRSTSRHMRNTFRTRSGSSKAIVQPNKMFVDFTSEPFQSSLSNILLVDLMYRILMHKTSTEQRDRLQTIAMAAIVIVMF